jgi:hypothetical protein
MIGALTPSNNLEPSVQQTFDANKAAATKSVMLDKLRAAYRRIAELEAETAQLRKIANMHTSLETCGDCGGIKSRGIVCLNCQS